MDRNHSELLMLKERGNPMRSGSSDLPSMPPPTLFRTMQEGALRIAQYLKIRTLEPGSD